MSLSITEEKLLEFLKKCRWFAGKARQVSSCGVSQQIPFGEVFIWIVEVNYEEGDAEQYQLPVAIVPRLPDYPTGPMLIREDEEQYLIDATYTPSFQKELYSRLYHAGKEGKPLQELEFNRGKGLEDTDLPETISSRILLVDSSNSAMIFGEKYFFKLYRKLFRETNPEVEMVEFITEYSSFRQIPAFCGSITWKGGHSDITLGMMQRKVDAEKDSWSVTGDYLNDFLYAVPYNVFSIKEEVFERVGLLGRRTGQMHLALFNPKAGAAFAPEPFTDVYRRFLRQRLAHLLDTRYSLLIDKYLELDEPTQRLAWKFMESKELIDEFSHNLLNQPLDSLRIRIHGDYHLGQVLSVHNDFVLIDFEGEPEASIQDRKIKHSPLKDVAGMVRSYHYAVSAKIFHSHETQHIHPQKLLTVTDRWYKLMKDTYMEAYMESIGWPHPLFHDQNEINSLMLYYLLEKAVYELGYELSYRPDWVKIPLNGIVDVIREVEKMHG